MEVATAQEVEAGVENDKAVTPESLQTTYLDRLSDSTPEDVGTGAIGNSARAARGDHAHGGGTGGGVTLSDDDPRSVSTGANAEGTATDASQERPSSPSSCC